MTLPQEEVWSLQQARNFLIDLATMSLGDMRKNARQIRANASARLRHFPADYIIDELWKERIEKTGFYLGVKNDA